MEIGVQALGKPQWKNDVVEQYWRGRHLNNKYPRKNGKETGTGVRRDSKDYLRDVRLRSRNADGGEQRIWDFPVTQGVEFSTQYELCTDV